MGRQENRSKATKARDSNIGQSMREEGGVGTFFRAKRDCFVTRAERSNAGWRNDAFHRSEEHTSELQSLMRISYAVFCLKKKTNIDHKQPRIQDISKRRGR